jgi:hypothetical protein
MPKPLGTDDVLRRLRDHPLESYALISNVAKGIALGVGSLVLLEIVGDIQVEWLRLFPWLASLAAVLISYVKWTRGALLSNARTNVWDSVFPLLIGVVEFLLFGVIAVEKSQFLLFGVVAIEKPASFLWLNWPLCLAVHALTASALVHNRLRLSLDSDLDTDMSDLGNLYKRWLRNDRLQAGVSGLGIFGIWVANRFWVLPTYGRGTAGAVVAALGFLSFVAAWKPISDANRQRDEIDKFVSAVKPASRAAAA